MVEKAPETVAVRTGEPPADRREHPRVQDAIGLGLQRLEELAAAGEAAPTTPSPIRPGTLPSGRASRYEIPGYAEVRRHHPEVAAWIDSLEERIRRLQLDAQEPPGEPSHKVSLSAGGLLFADPVLLHPGDIVGLTITLFPSGHRIGTDALVIGVNDAPEIAKGDLPTYRVSFVRLSDDERVLLAAHVDQLLAVRPDHG